jgi:hypothetical protein
MKKPGTTGLAPVRRINGTEVVGIGTSARGSFISIVVALALPGLGQRPLAEHERRA